MCATLGPAGGGCSASVSGGLWRRKHSLQAWILKQLAVGTTSPALAGLRPGQMLTCWRMEWQKCTTLPKAKGGWASAFGPLFCNASMAPSCFSMGNISYCGKVHLVGLFLCYTVALKVVRDVNLAALKCWVLIQCCFCHCVWSQSCLFIFLAMIICVLGMQNYQLIH